MLRNRDLDVWVEAWVPGSGWVTSDPAPPPQLKLTPAQRFSRFLEDAGVTVFEQTVGRPVRMAFDTFIVAVAGAFVVLTRRLSRYRSW